MSVPAHSAPLRHGPWRSRLDPEEHAVNGGGRRTCKPRIAAGRLSSAGIPALAGALSLSYLLPARSHLRSALNLRSSPWQIEYSHAHLTGRSEFLNLLRLVHLCLAPPSAHSLLHLYLICTAAMVGLLHISAEEVNCLIYAYFKDSGSYSLAHS